MPITDQFRPFTIRAVPGQDTKRRTTVIGENRCLTAQNLRADDEVGSVTKRPPIALFNATSLGSGALHSLFRYYTVDNKFLLAAHGSTMYVGDDDLGTFTALATGFTSGKIFTFAVYRDLCIFSNGFEPIKQTDAEFVWDLGACKAKSAGAGAITRTGISYRITIDADTFRTEATSNTIASVTAEDIELTNIPLGPAGTANRKVYRKSSETGGAYLNIGTIGDNTTTTFTDNVPDATVGPSPRGDVIGATTDQMPVGKYLKIHRERLFVAGDPDDPNKIFYSNAFLPHFIRQTTTLDFLEISPEDGDIITGIPILLGSIFIFKRNNIRKLNVEAADPDDFFVDDPTSFQGAPADRTITETPNGIVYLGWDHIYRFDGSFSEPVIDEFDVKQDIKQVSLQRTVGFWHNNVYLLAYISNSGTTSNQDRLMRYEWLRDSVNEDTVGVASFAAYDGDAEANELYYGLSRDGCVALAENFDKLFVLNTKTQLNAGLTYPTTIFSGLDDIALTGDEDSPVIEIGRTTKIDDAVGTIDGGFVGEIIDRADTDGVYTSEAIEINAKALGVIRWNEVLPSGTDVVFSTRTASTEAGLTGAFEGALTTPSGSTVISAADKFIQIRATLTTSDITMTPKIFTQEDFTILLTYTPGGNEDTTAIPFIYDTGLKDGGSPHEDKILKKIVVLTNGNAGTYSVDWETDLGETGAFTVDLALNPKRFETFFQDNAYGRQFKFKISKSDTEDFTLREILGIWTPRPVII